MTSGDERRAWLLTKLLVGEGSIAEAADLMASRNDRCGG